MYDVYCLVVQQAVVGYREASFYVRRKLRHGISVPTLTEVVVPSAQQTNRSKSLPL